jgi:hypothetical protein
MARLAPVLMRDGHRHRMRRTAAGIHEAIVALARCRRSLEHPACNARLDRLGGDERASTSCRNTARYSADAEAGSRSIASSIVRCGNVGFIARVSARHTSTGASSRPCHLRNASTQPLLQLGDLPRKSSCYLEMPLRRGFRRFGETVSWRPETEGPELALKDPASLQRLQAGPASCKTAGIRQTTGNLG